MSSRNVHAFNRDPLLHPLAEAPGDDERQRELELVLVEQAQPIIRRVIRGMRGTAILAQDSDEIASMVTLRLIARLQQVAAGEVEAIGSLGDFVARLTYNAVYDFLRGRFPERTRLKNRLRYVIRSDRRFVARIDGGNIIVALAKWGVRNDACSHSSISPNEATPQMLRTDRTADALAAVLLHIGAPVHLDDLVAIFAELWGVSDRASTAPREPIAASNPEHDLEMRRHLAALWREIAGLPANQRTALLLNLRDRDGLNALALFVLLGVTTVADLAGATGLTVKRLSDLWDDLPLDDLRIAGMLGVTRQQVINLRKSARARLARRMRQ